MKVFIDDVIADGEVKGKLFLESDERQFILKEYTGNFTTDAKGVQREQFNSRGYYPNIQSALRHFLKMKIKESTATTLQELATDFESISRYIESKFDYDVTKRHVEAEEGQP